MTEMVPLLFRWDGEHMVPLDRFVARANQQYVVGEVYRLNVELDRSEAEHRYFFAAFHEACLNLPSNISERFFSDDGKFDETHFRSWCLVRCGYIENHHQIVLDTATDLARTMDFLRKYNRYAIIKKSGNVIDIFTAKSQSHRSMDKAEFHKSATDVLELVAAMIGTTADELKSNAGQAA